MNCPNCGKELPEGAAFCLNCGTKITSSDANQMNMNQQSTPVQQVNTPNQNNNQFQDMPNTPQPNKNKNTLVIVLIAVVAVLLIAGGVLLFFVLNGSDKKETDDDKDSKSTSQTTIATTTTTTTSAYGYDNPTNNTSGTVYTVDQVVNMLNSDANMPKVIEDLKKGGIDMSITAEGNSIVMNMKLMSEVVSTADLNQFKSELKSPEGQQEFQDDINKNIMSESTLNNFKKGCPSLESFRVCVYDENGVEIYKYDLSIS